MLEWTDSEKINIALPSLRVTNFPQELMEKLTGVRRSGLTFAPEAGTQRLRDAINKNITEDEVLSTARKAFSGGWTSVKLYFMQGLLPKPWRILRALPSLHRRLLTSFYRNPDKPKGKSVSVSVSVSSFVPKPFTPFNGSLRTVRSCS
jgi:radical SAM superfamily enzyme YgiQ (UPF0313 family)